MTENTERGERVNNRLKEFREEARLTQDELSAKSGVTRQTINYLENDPAYNPTVNTLKKLADALGRTIQEIFLP